MSPEDQEKKTMATAEVMSFSQPVVLAPPDQCMIATEDLWKTYDMGSEQQVHALRGVNLRIQRSAYEHGTGTRRHTERRVHSHVGWQARKVGR